MSVCQYILKHFGDSLPQLRRMASYSDDILLNIPLAPVTLLQLSSCLSKAAVTEKRRCCCDYNTELSRLIYFLTTDGYKPIIH